MKARYINFNKQQRRLLEYLSQCRSVKLQYLMCVAMNDVFGIGKSRFTEFFARYDELLQEYKGLQQDEIGDEMLLRRIKQMGLLEENATSLYSGVIV